MIKFLELLNPRASRLKLPVVLTQEPLNHFAVIRAVLRRGLSPLQLGDPIPDIDVRIHERRKLGILRNSIIGEHLSLFPGKRTVPIRGMRSKPLQPARLSGRELGLVLMGR